MSPDLRAARWYKDAVIYEIHVRAFLDSNNDGKGDFQGLTSKLDYIQDLGVTAVWLLPFYPSPWRDDGYDISDYTTIHPAYGSLADFRMFMREAHRRGIRVITELVLNHTSDQHPWFQRARRARAGSRQREFYVWSDTTDKYRDARIIFKDFQSSNWTWDPAARAYYWHRFFSHQPDLNFDHPLVRRAIFRVIDFWLDQGVDGFRLDAVPYLFEREGTPCEHLPETHAFLREIRRHIDSRYPNTVLLAEANLWPEDAVSYLRADECQMSFHFPLMPRLFSAIRMEDRYPIIEILRQTPAIPETSQWALFLRNHDELTLEMVTDEERDYMYRVYAQDPQTRINLGIRRRLAPLLDNDRRRIELMNGLLFSLPGTPVLYYGDEIGMGDNVYLGDRNGVRTPMQWSMDRNAGFSGANPHRLYLPVNIDPEYRYEAVNVEVQQNTSHSLLWWVKRLIAVRKQFYAFGRGTLEFLQPENRKVLVFLRQYDGERILVVANLSHFVQSAELDLAAFKGLTPVEMLGRSELPVITDGLFHVTLNPYAFYWLSLEDRRSSIEALPGIRDTGPAVFTVNSLTTVFDHSFRVALSEILPRFLRSRRWFRGRGRRVVSVTFPDIIPLRPSSACILLTQVEFDDEEEETYALFASVAAGDEMRRIEEHHPDAVAVRLKSPEGEEGILYSALWDDSFAAILLDVVARRRRIRGDNGDIAGMTYPAFRGVRSAQQDASATVHRAVARNNSFTFDEACVLKLYRRVEPGTHPEGEIDRFLENASFAHTAPVAGQLTYIPAGGETITLGILHSFLPHETDVWHHTLDTLGRFFERAQTRGGPPDEDLFGAAGVRPLALCESELPPVVADFMGEYPERARLLGQRTAELHRALASDPTDADFSPEPMTDFYRQGLYHALISQTARLTSILRPGLEDMIRDRLRQFRDSRISGSRIRVHGNYNLHDVLYTGKDFAIIDFEGDPDRHLTERRVKRAPFYDVAGLMASLHDAARASHCDPRWAECWYRWTCAVFLKGYINSIANSDLLPIDRTHRAVLLDVLCLERFLMRAERAVDPDARTSALDGIARVIEGWVLTP